jgi:hypothetical protein
MGLEVREVQGGEGEDSAEEEVVLEGDLGDDVLVELLAGREGGECEACCCCVEVKEL